MVMAGIIVQSGMAVFAEDGAGVSGSVAADVHVAVPAARNIKTRAMENRDEAKGIMQEKRAAVKEMVAEKKEAIQERKLDLKAAIAGRKEAFDKAREEFRAKMETRKEEFKTKREAIKAELKVKLGKIKDERKKEIVDRLDNKLADINARLTAHWAEALNHLSELVTKISSRADKAAANGADVSAVRTRITAAEAANAVAKSAVAAQAAKTYAIAITTEDKLKADVAAMRQTLNNDLKIVRDAVQAARKAVEEAVKALKAVPKVDTATTTPAAL